MKKTVSIFFTAYVAILASCTSTRIESSWREKDKQISIDQLKKVLVVALLDNETSNRRAEEQIAGYLNGKAVVSFSYLDDSIRKNKIAIRTKISNDGFDGAITMRLVDVDKEVIYKPGIIASYPGPYLTFSKYYYNSWSYFMSSGHYVTTKTYSVVTNIYSIRENKIIWTSLIKSINCNGIKKMTEEIASVLNKKMITEGLISKQ
jgi:hypothetical protein